MARRFIKDPELLRFIDLECFTYSTVKADLTPMVKYPVGGIGRIAETVAEGESGRGWGRDNLYLVKWGSVSVNHLGWWIYRSATCKFCQSR